MNSLAAYIKSTDPILEDTSEGQKPTHAPEQKRQICDELKDTFKAATDVKQWISIIRTLGNLARQAQNEKTGIGDSDFCWTLHAIRNYIISKIHPHILVQLYPKLCTIPEHQQAKQSSTSESTTYAAELDKRRADTSDAEEGISDRRATTTGIKKADIDLNKILFDRANLGDTRAAEYATIRGVFTGMAIPPKQTAAELTSLDISLKKISVTTNYNWPTCYQIEFFRIFFNEFIQTKREQAGMMKWANWEQFEAKAIAGEYEFGVTRPDVVDQAHLPLPPVRQPVATSPLATLSLLATPPSSDSSQTTIDATEKHERKKAGTAVQR